MSKSDTSRKSLALGNINNNNCNASRYYVFNGIRTMQTQNNNNINLSMELGKKMNDNFIFLSN